MLEVWEHGHSAATDRRGMAMGCLRAPDTPREALRWRGGQQNQRGRHTRLVGRGHRVAAKRASTRQLPQLRPVTPAGLTELLPNLDSPKTVL